MCRMVKDHFIPLVQGGIDDHSNLMPACPRCDCLKRGNLPPRNEAEVKLMLSGELKLKVNPRIRPKVLKVLGAFKSKTTHINPIFEPKPTHLFRFWYNPQTGGEKIFMSEFRAQNVEAAKKRFYHRKGIPMVLREAITCEIDPEDPCPRFLGADPRLQIIRDARYELNSIAQALKQFASDIDSISGQ